MVKYYIHVHVHVQHIITDGATLTFSLLSVSFSSICKHTSSTIHDPVQSLCTVSASASADSIDIVTLLLFYLTFRSINLCVQRATVGSLLSIHLCQNDSHICNRWHI